MRIGRFLAITVAALSLSTMGAHADGTWCATRSSNAKLLSRAMADFATVTPSQGTASNGAADTGGDC
jgi:hypothetical protein